MRPLVVALALTMGLAPVSLAQAGTPTDELRTYTEQVLKIVEDTRLTPGDRRAAVRKVANEIFDVTETARRALARHWAARTPGEREEFVQLFADLLERTYIARIDEYGGERIRFVGESIEGDTATVRSRIVTRRGTEVPVDARMHQRNGRWLMYDVLIEGVSLVSNYRSQFDRIVRTASYEELIRRLKIQRDEFAGERASGSRRSE